ncbi:hypothetical protein VaNZ11_000853 [Volvox africanus]|uniref:Uncharacterized protein n=1 Tax=Volvox africanus TaxID=51714 RepID=A0ABQ5RN99_9CHLO|nr:hypothetical protein VaNZ11_000853 [Volvox africanus]
MRKEATGRVKEMAPKVAKPAVLSAEAAAMEQKLAELRKAMEKERAKRDALMANTGGGSIWRNGGSNSGLRTSIKGKGPGEGSAASGSLSGGGPSSSRRPSGSDAPSRQGSGSSSTRAASARTAGTESEVPSVSGNRVASARAAMNVNPPEPKGRVGGGIIGRAATGGGDGGGSAAGGTSCGTDDNPALADGAFNEADSHKSFLEALNEWRRANRGDAAAEGEGQAAATTTSISGVSSVPQRLHSARPSATLEVQTDSRSASRPSSAKPLSYFDKLVINTSSRVAGHLASGGPPETIRTSLSGQATGLARSPSSSRPPLAPGPNTTIATGGAKAAAASVPVEMSSATTTATATVTTTTNSSPSAAVVSADGGGVASSDGRKAPLPDPLTILDRLEALERQRQAADDDDEHEEVAIQVTTATGLLLTKGTRLPDEVLMPPNQEC